MYTHEKYGNLESIIFPIKHQRVNCQQQEEKKLSIVTSCQAEENRDKKPLICTLTLRLTHSTFLTTAILRIKKQSSISFQIPIYESIYLGNIYNHQRANNQRTPIESISCYPFISQFYIFNVISRTVQTQESLFLLQKLFINTLTFLQESSLTHKEAEVLPTVEWLHHLTWNKEDPALSFSSSK